MDLSAHYAAMRTAALQQWQRGQAELDTLLDSPHDTRRGLTLLLRPPTTVREAIAGLLDELRPLAPGQYFYPAADLHLTVLSIISCIPGLRLTDIEPEAYAQVVAEVLQHTPPFTLRLAGLTAAPNGVLLQGFPQGPGLAELRERLRAAFRASGLRHSIDSRYRLATAHITLLRFRQPLCDATALAEAVAARAGREVGTFTATELELVYNDWYQRADNTVLVKKFSL